MIRAVIRKAFLMRVDPDAHEVYERRHAALWPEMADLLKAHGVLSYSIFLDRARSLLFAYAEVDSEERWAAIAGTEVCRRWWAFMRDVMATNPDGSPVSDTLHEVFHLE